MFCFFARFHVRKGSESAASAVLLEVVAPTRAEAGCVEMHAFQAKHDGRLFIIHSRWEDEASFNRHAELPHTVKFIGAMERFVDEPMETVRTELLA